MTCYINIILTVEEKKMYYVYYFAWLCRLYALRVVNSCNMTNDIMDVYNISKRILGEICYLNKTYTMTLCMFKCAKVKFDDF